MYTYYLSVAIANKDFSFSESPQMLDFIKDGIAISNNSFSASRQKRTIEFKELIDDKHMLFVMKSRVEINPTRSLSSLSRSLYDLEAKRGTNLLTNCTSNGCLFNASQISEPPHVITLEELSESDSLLLKGVIDLVYSSDEQGKTELRKFILPYINGDNKKL